MNFQEVKKSLEACGFEYHMQTGVTTHYWKNNVHVAINPVYFEVSDWLYSFNGRLDSIKNIKYGQYHITFTFDNDVSVKFPIGGN